MPKLTYNPVTGDFDYINKNSDFSISGLRDVYYSNATNGDSLVWNAALGKWSSQYVGGGTGAPDNASYVTISAEGGLSNETLAQDLAGTGISWVGGKFTLTSGVQYNKAYHSGNEYTAAYKHSAAARGLFFPSSLGKALQDFSSNKGLYKPSRGTWSFASSNKFKYIAGTKWPGNSQSVGGGVNINIGTQSGSALVVYGNTADVASTSHLVQIGSDNQRFTHQTLRVWSDGNNIVQSITQNNISTQRVSFTVSSASSGSTTFGVNGHPVNRGVIKVVHGGTPYDSDAAGVSIDLAGAGTAAQGLYIDATGGGTTGKLLRLRNNNIDKLFVGPDGSLWSAVSISTQNISSNKISSKYLNDISGNIRFRFVGSSSAIQKFLASSAFKRNNWNSEYWNNSGIVWDHSLQAWKPKKSGATGGVSNLSALIIDTTKDWSQYSIYNLKAISSQLFSGNIYYTKIDAPTNDRQLTNKKYVDDIVSAIGGEAVTGWALVSSNGKIAHGCLSKPTSVELTPSGSAPLFYSFTVDSTYIWVYHTGVGFECFSWKVGSDSILNDNYYNKSWIDALSGSIDTRIDSLGGFDQTNYITSANSILRFYPSYQGHYFTNSGSKLYSAYKSASTGIFSIASHTHSNIPWSGAYQFYAVSSLNKSQNLQYVGFSSNLHSYYNSGDKLNKAYKSASTGVFASVNHTHSFSDVSWSGAYQFYSVSSLNKTQNLQYTGFSSNMHYYYNSGDKLYKAYKSASTGIFAITNHIHSFTDVAWSGAYQFYVVSSNFNTRLNSIFNFSSNSNNKFKASSGIWNFVSSQKISSNYIKTYPFIVTNNRVGIGIANPSTQMHVLSGAYFGQKTLVGINQGFVTVKLTPDDNLGYIQALKMHAEKNGLDTLYGFNGTAVGANNTNIGIYGWAAGATTNWGLYIDAGNARFNQNVKIYGATSGTKFSGGVFYTKSDSPIDNRQLTNKLYVDTISSNTKSKYYPSSLGHQFTNSGTILTRSFQSSQRVYERFDHTSYHGTGSSIKVASLSSQGVSYGQWVIPLYESLTTAGVASSRPGQIIRTSGNDNGTWVWISIYGGTNYYWMQLTYLRGV